MENNKYIERILVHGIFYGNVIKHYFIEKINDLDLLDSFKEKILSKIKNKENFEITLKELNEILPVLDKKIEELLIHPDFDPQKETLRDKFKEQYESYPFHFKGKTYFLYSKTFPIDSLIGRINDFKLLIKEHIKRQVQLKFIFKE